MLARPDFHPDTEWKRDGRLVYCLAQYGWHRGQPQYENAVTVNVVANTKYLSQEDAEKIAAYIRAVLNEKLPPKPEQA